MRIEMKISISAIFIPENLCGCGENRLPSAGKDSEMRMGTWDTLKM
jgi:hypothetical protein